MCTLPMVERVSPQILLLCATFFTTCQADYSQPGVVYVKPESGTSCPPTHSVCKTLEWYSNNSDTYFASNTLIVFLNGAHSLETFIEVHNCHNFTMTGNGSASLRSDGLPKPTSQIRCHGANKSGLHFFNSTNISIRNIEFESCGNAYYLRKFKENFASTLAFFYVQDVSLDQIVISKAMGYALLTNNIYGTNRVANSAFLHAKNHPCAKDSGNANFGFGGDCPNFTDTELVVTSSWFMYGQNTYAVRAGGLNVYMNCSTGVHVTIFNVTARGNSGPNGNLALYLVDYAIGNGSSIVINHSRIMDGRGFKGGGMRFGSHHSYGTGGSSALNVHQILSVVDTIFHNNSVNQTGGAMYIAYYNNSTIRSYDGTLRQVTISNCNFTNNGGNGAAMEIVQLSDHRAVPLYQTMIENCNFKDNFMPTRVDGPIVDLISVEASVRDSTFTGSNTTVMSLRNAQLNLFGDIKFENNFAVLGGALKLCELSLVFGYDGTDVQFINNRAQKGGAIYIQQACMDTSPLCFFQPSLPKGTLVMDFDERINMEFTFVNNSAAIAGDAIYGGALDLCSTILPYTWNNSLEAYDYTLFPDIIKKVFVMHEQPGPSWISSHPRQVCFCQRSQQDNSRSCMTELELIKVYPGEQFTVAVITVGQMNGSTSGVVNASLENEHTQNHTLVRWNHPEASSECINLTFALNSNRKSAQINFQPVTPEIATRYKAKTVKLDISLQQCPLGFKLTDSPPYTCVCSPLLTKFLSDIQKYAYNSPVTCNVSSKIISVPQRRMWFGCFDPEYRNNSSECSSLVVTPNCDYYCNHTADIIDVSISKLDSQCSPNHTGIMCGSCKPGFSRVLGNTLECREDCTDKHLLFLIPFFLASGFLLVIIIMALNLTVTEGTLNGLLVYTMIIGAHRSYFPEELSAFGRLCWAFISWINLTFGIKTCFYKGMDGYQHTWGLFAQAFYFLLIQVLIVLLTRKFIFFTRLFGRNIVKVLATLFFLLYSNVIFAMFTTFRYAALHYSTQNGTLTSKLTWYYDGNLPYFGRKHAPLFVIALIWLIVILFFVFSLLLIQCLQRQTNLWCFHWVIRLRPFYEAFTGPCHNNYRFWPGFLLFMRTGLYVMNSLIPSYSDVLFQIKMLVTAAVCVIIMSLACIFPRGVYKRWPLNVLEFSFFLNLCITSGILGFSGTSHIHQRYLAVYTSVSISAFTFLGILIYHFHRQVKDTRGWRKLSVWFSVRVQLPRIVKQRRSREGEEIVSESDTDERDLLLPQALPHVVKFDNYREPLVEA